MMSWRIAYFDKSTYKCIPHFGVHLWTAFMDGREGLKEK